MDMQPPFMKMRPYLPALTDAIHFCDLAHNTPATNALMFRYINSSLLSSALSIEALANVLLEHTPHSPKELRKRFERFTALEKLSFFVWMRTPGKTLPTGGSPCQRVTELMDIRDRTVHTRTATHPAVPAGAGPGDINFRDKDISVSEHLKIPRSQFLWKPEHAVTALTVVVSFTDYILLELCGITAENTTQMLCHAMILDEHKMVLSMGTHERSLLRLAQDKWGLLGQVFTERIMKE